MSTPEIKQKFDRKSNLTPGGPGRPPGQKNYSTLYKEALLKVASETEIGDPELEMIANAVKLAKRGDYRFYKDLMDRKYGQAVARSENLNANFNAGKLADEDKARLDELIK